MRISKKSRAIDLTGQIFGRWTVLKRAENKGNGVAHWLCQCSCEKKSIKIVSGRSLRNGQSTSCGCIHKEQLIEFNRNRGVPNTYDLSGNYGVGYTAKGEEFYFDLEDYELLKDIRWYKNKKYRYIYCPHVNNQKGNMIFLSRLIMNASKGEIVDHINHNRIDNRKSNLRICTQSQNLMNKCKQANNTSGFKGVTYDRRDDKWIAQIKVGNKLYRERFVKLEDAVECRKQMDKKYFNKFAYNEELSMRSKIKKRINIFIDFDNTIVNSTKKLIELLNLKHNTNINWEDVKKYNCTDVFPNVSHEEILNIFNNKDFFKELDIFNNFNETLIKYKNYCNYYICTIGTKNNLSLKKKWCYKNMPITYGFYGIEKLDMNKESVDMVDGIIIDDHIQNLRSSNAKYKILFKGEFDTDWNCKLGYEDYIEVRNWEDILVVLDNILIKENVYD